MNHHERKRYYKIHIRYEPEDLIAKEFDISYEEMHEKVKGKVIPLLLNHINRIKKKNELRAEIKRVNANEKVEEEEENDGEGG